MDISKRYEFQGDLGGEMRQFLLSHQDRPIVIGTVRHDAMDGKDVWKGEGGEHFLMRVAVNPRMREWPIALGDYAMAKTWHHVTLDGSEFVWADANDISHRIPGRDRSGAK